jgi:DNA-binding NtrC family response regulator
MSRKSVLIIEDDLDIAENLRALFTLEGYDAAISKDGREALARLNANGFRPDVILLDLMMPVMDGFQFYQAQQSNAELSKIPVIVMTAGGNVEAKVSELGAQAFFRKPIDVDRLFETIERLIAN